MYQVGSILQSFFTLGCGLARNANELIIFRGLSGIAIAFCLPSAVSIITSTLHVLGFRSVLRWVVC
jgi:MFS family permease